MANQSKLKAWVRYDGTGRVISGGPIFQVNKPKVGNWKQIDANLCCNNGSTTTTTTTTGGGGGTPTAFIKSYFLNTFNACNSTFDGNLLFYSSSSTLQAGITVFTDAALTQPVTPGFVIANQIGAAEYVYYLVGQGGVLSAFDCSQLYYSLYKGFSQSGICTSSFSTYVTFSTGSSIIVGQTIVYENGIPFQVNPGIPAYITFPQLGYAIYEMAVGGIIIAITGSCETTTTTTTSLPVFTVENQRWGNTQGDACGSVNPLTTFYTTGPLQFGNYLQDGNVIYLDQALTQPVQYPFILSPGIGRLLDCNNGVLSNQRGC